MRTRIGQAWSDHCGGNLGAILLLLCVMICCLLAAGCRTKTPTVAIENLGGYIVHNHPGSDPVTTCGSTDTNVVDVPKIKIEPVETSPGEWGVKLTAKDDEEDSIIVAGGGGIINKFGTTATASREMDMSSVMTMLQRTLGAAGVTVPTGQREGTAQGETTVDMQQLRKLLLAAQKEGMLEVQPDAAKGAPVMPPKDPVTP